MAYGIQVYDASGNLTLDVSDRTLRLVATVSYTIPSGSTGVNVTVSGMVDDGTWQAVAVPTTGNSLHTALVGAGTCRVADSACWDSPSLTGTLYVFRW